MVAAGDEEDVKESVNVDDDGDNDLTAPVATRDQSCVEAIVQPPSSCSLDDDQEDDNVDDNNGDNDGDSCSGDDDDDNDDDNDGSSGSSEKGEMISHYKEYPASEQVLLFLMSIPHLDESWEIHDMILVSTLIIYTELDNNSFILSTFTNCNLLILMLINL